jgi:hypothetical protein
MQRPATSLVMSRLNVLKDWLMDKVSGVYHVA